MSCTVSIRPFTLIQSSQHLIWITSSFKAVCLVRQAISYHVGVILVIRGWGVVMLGMY